MAFHHRAPHAGTLAVLFVVLSTVAWAQFETRSSTPIIYEPQSVAVADFNHDGKLDVATTTFVYSGQVAVLLGRGDGTFQPAVYYNVDSHDQSLYWIAAADFNGDGNVDLAVADALGYNISILLGNGDGTFQPPVQYPTTEWPGFVATGDFNNDGKPDLIIVNRQYVSVMLGNGDGTFQPPIDNTILSPSDTGTLGLGDFNHDGNLDVAVPEPVGSAGLGILLGNGDGTFREGAQYAVGSVSAVAVADFNRDHKLDLAVIDAESNPIQVLLGNGDGTFQLGASYAATLAYGITTSDVNGDGKLDLLFVTTVFPSGTSRLTVMLGNGDGTFQPPVYYLSFVEALYIAMGDFNGDHQPDVAVSDYRGNAVDLLLNTGVVSFSPTTPISFNPQLLGTTSTPQNVMLKNTGTTTLSIASKRLSGPFQLASGTTCGSSVSPHANCTLSITFTPTAIGLKSGLLSISDSASSKPQVIELSGTGTVITFSPTQLSFGSVKVGTKSSPQNVTVTNMGGGAVSVTSITIAGSESADFLQANTCGTHIPAGASCTISVTFAPQFTGNRHATLEIFDNGGASPQQISLTGTGA